MKLTNEEREKLVVEYMDLVDKIAGRLHKWLQLESIEELKSDGHLALVNALNTYDPNRGMSLKNYIAYKVWNDTTDYVRSRNKYRQSKKYGIKIEPDQDVIEEITKTKYYNPEDIVEQIYIIDVLKKGFNGLKPREKEIVKARYMEGRSIKEIGAIYGICESRVTQIAKKSLKKIRLNLQNLGIERIEEIEE